MKTNNRKYYIPVDGKMYETSEDVYRVYYKMDRRERYLEERSRKYNVSYEALEEANYPIEEKLHEPVIGLEDSIIKKYQVEELLGKLSILSSYEMWLVEELYSHCKSERRVGRESGIPRKH